MSRTPSWNDARKTFLLENVPGSTSYWTLNDLEYAYALPAPATPPSPLDTVTTIWLYGASIEDGVSKVGDLTDYTPALTNYVTSLVGRPITVVDKGVPSQTMDMILSRFNTDDLAAATALGDQLLIMSMPMGNDITINRPYPGGAAGITSDYEALMTAFLSSGAYVLPSTATFRNYASSVNDEANGSLPYNENIFVPYIQGMATSMWDDEDNLPYNDPYNLARNWYSILLADEVHYTNAGYRILGRYWMDVAAARILGQWPARIPRVPDPTVTQANLPRLPCAWKANSGSAYNTYPYIMGMMDRGVFNTQVDGICIPIAGEYAPNAITCTHFSIPGGSASNSTNLAVGNDSNSLLNDRCRVNTFPTESTTFVPVCTWKGLAPGQAFEVDILSCRYASSGDATRITEFSFDGTTVAGECLSAYSTAQAANMTLLTLSGTANGSGEVPLYFRRKTGSTFGYINGAVLRPL